MTDYEIRRRDEEAARRAAAEIRAQVEAHLQQQRQTPPAPGTGQHAPRGARNLTIHGDVYARTIHVGDRVTTSASPREQALQATLEHLLVTLPQAGLRYEDARAVRKATLRTLSEARAARPRPRKLRRGLHEVTIALITGIASGSANEVAGDLLRSLQHITP